MNSEAKLFWSIIGALVVAGASFTVYEDNFDDVGDDPYDTDTSISEREGKICKYYYLTE